MKKLLKVLLILFAIVVVLGIAGTMALRVYLPPEKAKALVLKHLSEQLKREVQLGSASVGLFSGLELAQLKVSEAPTFAQGTFLSSEQFSLKVSLLPLLSKKIVIRQVILKKPEVTVIRMADGKTFNFSDLTETAKPTNKKDSTPAEGGQSFQFLVSNAEIQEGALHFVDKSPAKQSVDISPFDLKLQNVSLAGPFSLQLATKIKYQGRDIGVRLGGDTNLLSGVFNITTGEIATGQAKISLSGQLTELKTQKPAFKLHVETNDVPVKELLAFAPDAVPQGTVIDGKTKLALDLTGTSAKLDFAAKWSGTDLRIEQGENFRKAAGVPLELSATGDRVESGLVSVKNMAGKLSENQLSGSCVYEPRGEKSIITLSLKGPNWAIADLAKLSPAMTPFQPSGKLSFDLRASGLAKNPNTTINTTANIKLGEVKHPYYEGKGLELVWDLSNITPDLSKLSGVTNLKQGPGKILKVKELAENSRAGQIALAPVAILAKLQEKGALKQFDLPSFQTIPFDSLVGDYVIKSGVMNIKKFELLGKDLNILNQGTVGLSGAQALQMKVALSLAEGAIRGDVGNLMKDASGRPVVKFAASGTVADPKIKWDIADVKKKAVEELMKNEDVQKATEGLQKTLEGIFR